MKAMCGIALLSLFIPWIIGICVCLWRYFSILWDKVIKWFELRKDEKQKLRCLEEYKDWYGIEHKAMLKACILNDRYERKNLFSKDDLKIWKAFI